MWSTRVPDERRPTRVARALAAARARGPLADLTVSNPTRVGIRYPPEIARVLDNPEALAYRPEPLGLPGARRAVAATYAARGIAMPPERIVLTASTSEAYSLLFKLLCDPGRSSVLTPVPSYPLFDHLARLDGVTQRRYALDFHGAWSVDVESLTGAWTDDTRAVLAVSPNNPTGSLLDAHDADELTRRCASRDAALIVDEVFCDYPLRDAIAEPPALHSPACLLARLGGLSKTVGLPQMKLGWIAFDGPDAIVAEALDRLELIADTYLSVSTPVQVAARPLLEIGAIVREQILERIRANYASLVAHAKASPFVSVLPADAGWSAVVRVPATRSEEALVLDLLERDAIAVHPGYFFDFPHEAFLVVSLLPPPEIFEPAVRRILERVDA